MYIYIPICVRVHVHVYACVSVVIYIYMYIARPGQAVKLPRGCLPHLRDLRPPPGAPGTAPIWGWTMPGPLVRTRAGAAPQGMAFGPTGGSSALGRAGGRGELPGEALALLPEGRQASHVALAVLGMASQGEPCISYPQGDPDVAV